MHWISNVSLGSINHSPNNSTCSSISNYTTLADTVIAGSTNPMTVSTTGWCGVAVLVDFNTDGDFGDAGELLYNGYIDAHSATYGINLMIPVTVVTGNYRMRVMNSVGNAVNVGTVGACYNSMGYGNFYDYTLRVVASCATPLSAAASPAFLCTSGTATLSLSYTSALPVTVKWYDGNGNLVGTGSPFTTPVLTATTTFYGAADNGYCDTPRLPVTVRVVRALPPPASISPHDTTICEGKTIPIQAAMAIIADTTIANNGNYSQSRIPVNGASVNSTSELIYTAAELKMLPGKITNIGFYKKNANTTFNPGAVTIYMKATAAGNTGATASTAGYTLVYTGTWPNVNVPANTWNNIVLNTPFDYNGTDNLALLIVRSAGTSNLVNFPVYRASSTAPSYRASSYIAGAWVSGSSTMIQDTLRPDIRIRYTMAPAVGWNPVASLFKDAALSQPMSTADTNTLVYTNTASDITYTVHSRLLGCTSANSLSAVIHVADTFNTTVADTICAGEARPFGTQNLTTSGTYTASFSSSAACDSTVTLKLWVRPYLQGFDTVRICAGQSHTFNGITYTTAQSGLKDTFSTAGCDSIVTLELIVDPNITPVFTAVAPICAGSAAPVLPLTSSNGISGTWSPATVSNTATGTYTFTPNAGQCATTATLTITVNNGVTTTDNRTACASQLPYTWNGIPNATNGTTYAVTAANGCDSIVTLSLSISPYLQGHDTVHICQGQTHTFNGVAYTTSQSGLKDTFSTAGCDSIVTFELIVDPNITPAFAAVAPICAGGVAPVLPLSSTNGITGTWSPATISNTATGTYTFTPDAGQCATTATLTITVNNGVTTTDNRTACASQLPYTWNGIPNATNGTTYAVTAANGCDSIVTLNLSISPYSQGHDTVHICQGQTHTFNGVAYTTSQSGLKDTFSTAGCDSIVTFELIVNPNITPVFTAVAPICAGSAAPVLPLTSTNGITGTWNPATVSNTTTGTYTFTPDAGQCTTTTTLSVTVNNGVSSTDSRTICASQQPYTWNGIPNATNGTTYTVTGANGCDSIVTLNLSISPYLQGHDTVYICQGQTHTFNGVAYTTSQSGLRDTFTTTACDSIVTLELIVDPNTTPVFTAIAPVCSGSAAPALPLTSTNGISGTWNPATVSNTATGTYTFTPDAGQCATTATLTITVNNGVTTTDNRTVCASQLPYTWNGILNATNGITYTATAANGCDSIVTLSLSISPYLQGHDTVHICQGQTYTFNGVAYTTSQSGLKDTFTTTACDSIVTLELIVNPNITPAFAAVAPICVGSTAPALPLTSTNGIAGTWSPASVSNTATGTYTFTPNAGQCATTATLTVTVNNGVTATDNRTICAAQLPYTWNGISNATNGTTYTATAGNGCDSIVTLNLIISPYLQGYDTVRICQGQTHTFNGVAYTTSQSGLRDTFTTTACDSIVTLELIVNPNITPAFAAVAPICAGSPAPAMPLTSTNGIAGTWSPASVSNTATGTYTFTPNAGQCATTATLTVTVTPLTTPVFTAIAPICSGSAAPVLPLTSTNGITGTWSPASVSNTATGTYTFTPNAGQCATTATLTVTVTPLTTPVFTAIAPICAGSAAPVLPLTSTNGITGTWSPATVSNTATGTYTFTPNAGQCATTATLTVTVTPLTTPVFTAIAPICAGSVAPVLPLTSTNGITGTWSPATVSNTATGTYTFTPNAGQCATTATLMVTVNSSAHTTDARIICAAQQPYTWNGIPNAINGTVWHTTTVQGCDSIVTLQLTVNPYLSSSATITICSGQIYTFNGITYNTSQTGLKDTFSTAACDSIVTLDLSVLPPPEQRRIDTAACGSLVYNGHTYTQGTIVYDTLRNTLGCDSIQTAVHIVIYPNTPHTRLIDTVGCGQVAFEGVTYNNSTTLEDTLKSIHGCDSIRRVIHIRVDHFELNLTAEPEDPYAGEQVRLQTSGNSDYTVTSWSPAAWFPDQQASWTYLKAKEDGTITVMAINSNGCSDTAVLELKVKPLDHGVFMPNAFSPNGDGKNDRFGPRFRMSRAYVIKQFRVFNRWGQVVFSRFNRGSEEGWDGTSDKGTPAEIGTYSYYIEISFPDGKELKLNGDVTLIR